MPANEPPRLVLRWEALERGPQVAIAFPLLFVVITAIHFALPGHRTWWSNIVYGFGYAFVLTAVVIGVTEGERRRRAEREHAAEPPADPPPPA